MDAGCWPLRTRRAAAASRRRPALRWKDIVETRDVDFVTAACEGELVRGDARARIERVCTDSRKVQPGDLFFALAGERFDGHDFVAEVMRQGAAAVVVARDKLPRLEVALHARGGPAEAPPSRCAVIAVDDTRRALGRLAAVYRRDFDLPVVAVGGSNGKTTTKELIASVLSRRWPVLWSEASFNNDIGVPLTLLRLERAHQAAVLEVGTNHPGELAPLVRMVAPRYGVITSIGREHLEFFGDLEGVAREQGALAEGLPADGVLFLNADSEWAERIAARTRARVVRVGLGPQNDWRARSIRFEARAGEGAEGVPAFGVTFEVDAPDRRFDGEYRLNLLGRHQALNALLAIAVGAELGLSPEQIRRGLLACSPPKMRLQLFEHRGVRVLDDAYNANADSTIAALETLLELPCEGRRIAVLGEMAELGAHSEAAHVEVGRRAAELGVGQVFAVGKMASAIARGAREAGLVRVMEFEDVESATAVLKRFVKPGDVVLVKASRVARLERISEALRSNGNGTHA
jgi:UDP-N-acetylmuramoyl-tripeptide--D-alanyl-D-alanine ligase